VAATRPGRARHLLPTGLRSAELLEPRVDSLVGRPGERRPHVTGKHGKGGRARSVPVEPPLVAVLDGYLASRQDRVPHHRLPHHRLSRRRPVRRHPPASRCDAAACRAWSPPRLHHAALGRFERPARPRRPGARACGAPSPPGSPGTAPPLGIMNLPGRASPATSQACIDATAGEHRGRPAPNRTCRAVARLADGDGAPPVARR